MHTYILCSEKTLPIVLLSHKPLLPNKSYTPIDKFFWEGGVYNSSFLVLMLTL